MAILHLSAGGTFTVIPEGPHIFQITAVKYNETYGKMEVSMQTEEGMKHVERYSMLDSNGQPNQGALNAFSYFAKVAMNNFDLTEIDSDELVGHFIECVVSHDIQPKRGGKPGETVTFNKLGDKAPASGFEPDANEPAPAPAKPAAKAYDLDSILG